MIEKLIIAVSPADLDAANDFRSAFEGKGVNLEIIECPSDNSNTSDLENAANCLLWLSPQTGDEVYELSSVRKEKGLATLNILSERFRFTPDQREKVGRNAIVIIPLTRGNIAEAVLNRLDSRTSSSSHFTDSPSEVASQTVTKTSFNSDPSATVEASTVVDSPVTKVAENQPSSYLGPTGSSDSSLPTEKTSEVTGSDTKKGEEEEYDPYGYQWTGIILFFVIYFAQYYIFGEIRSDKLFYHVLFLLDGLAGLFCLLHAWAGFKSKKFWRCVKSLLCTIVGIFGVLLWVSSWAELSHLFR